MSLPENLDFFTFSHAFASPDLYGASSFLETMPSRPSLQTALNNFHAIAFGVFNVLNAANTRLLGPGW